MIKIIYNLKDIGINNIKEVGGKAGNLGELIKINVNVPNGFVCTDLEFIKEEKQIKEIIKKYEQLDLSKVAIRSSAICEDSKDNSFAGQFKTILNVNKGM